MLNLLEKYKPTTIDEIIGHIEQKKKLYRYFDQFNGDNVIKQPNIIIRGPNGVGKTIMIDLFLENYSMKKITIDFNNIELPTVKKITNNAKDEHNIFYNSIIKKSCLFGKSDNIAIVIDNITTTTNNKSKDAIKLLYKINKKRKNPYPLIFIINTKHAKLVNELCVIVTSKKKDDNPIGGIIDLYELTGYDINDFMMSIAHKENIEFEEPIFTFKGIRSICESDIRKILDILSRIITLANKSGKKVNGKTLVDKNIIKDFLSTTDKKEVDIGLHEGAKKIFNSYNGIDNSVKYYLRDKSTFPLMIHMNYLQSIGRQFQDISFSEKINLISEISKNISMSDPIEAFIHSNQRWDLPTVHAYYSVVKVSYLMSLHKKTRDDHIRPEYTQDFNKMSKMKMNTKTFDSIRENINLKNADENDFLELSGILVQLDDNKMEEFNKVYNMTNKQLTNVRKMDMINN